MIACKHEIPYEVYSDWDNQVASNASEDEAESTIGNWESDTPEIVVKLEPGMAKFSTIEKGKGKALSSKLVEGMLIDHLQCKH